MDKGKVTLLACGDVRPGIEPADEIAELVLPVLRQADLRFGQCEAIYTERAPKTEYAQTAQGGIRHPYNPRLASLWKTAGIDVISLASNHTMDYGPESFLDTIELFRGWGKHVIGVGKDIDEARAPAIVECNGVKIAFLGYCSVIPPGHEAGRGKVGMVPMRAHTYYRRGGDPHEEYQPGTPQRIFTEPDEDDLKALEQDIRQAKQKADAVVISIHWGLHHIPKTICDYQPTVAHAAIDAGADLILGHHPHTLKAVEVYKGKVCFYSLGNFMITGVNLVDGKVPKGHRLDKPLKLWDFWWYRIDPECMPPHGRYPFQSDCRKTLLAKTVFSKKGVDKVSFLPAFINPLAQPAVVKAGDPKFDEIFEYVEWLSDPYPHKFRAEGDEIVVDTSS